MRPRRAGKLKEPAQLMRVVPHSSVDMAWAERFAGPLLYDNMDVKNPPASAAQDFEDFFKPSPQQTKLGSVRNKVQAGHAEFGQCVSSRDWTSTDEHWLRSSFWGCRLVQKDSESLFGQLDKSLLGALGKLCSLRHQAATSTHSQVGAWDLVGSWQLGVANPVSGVCNL